jgi:hypothetical protein
MQLYIRPVEQRALLALLALMKSALLLMRSAASQAVSQTRVWRSRSDLSCHQLNETPGSCGMILDGCACLGLGYGMCIVLLVMRQEHPHHPGVLVG